MREIVRVVKDAKNEDRIRMEASLKKLMASKGFRAVAASLSNPVKLSLDIKGTARKVYVLNKNIENGMPIFYETDLVRFPAVISAKGAGTYGLDVNVQKIFLNEKTFQTKLFVPREYLYTRTYDVWARARERIVEGLAIREDLELYGLASVAANSGLGHPAVTTTGRLDLSVISKAQSLIRDYNIPVSSMVINPSGQKGIQNTNRLNIDEKGMQEIRETGFLGNIYGMGNIIETVLTKPGTALVFGNPELFGQYYIRADSLVDEIPALERQRLGFVAYHMYAVEIHNAKAVVEIQFNPAA